MKKVLILLLSIFSLTAFAQSDIKRVAILEIVDKMGTVPYMKQLVFRSNLTTAISNTLGYEGYDRVDLQQILGEQNFQRTGMVSDADIKKIGEFTGAKYVIVAEAVIDGDEMFITAKMTDVETARVIRNSNQLMGTSTAEMKTGSEKVAADLLSPTVYEKAQMEAKQKEEAERQKYEHLQKQGYVDLGLPSGTWWKKENEDGCYQYQSAYSKFGKTMPTKEQIQELLDGCTFEFVQEEGCSFISKYNGNSIFFPAVCYGGCSETYFNKRTTGSYWSSTHYYEAAHKMDHAYMIHWYCPPYDSRPDNPTLEQYGQYCWWGAVRLVTTP